MTWTAADVMSRPAVTVGPSRSFASCLELMRQRRIYSLPVVMPDGKLVGIVTEGDLIRRLERGGTKATTAGDIMTRDVATIEPGATLAAAARLMIGRDVRRLPVVDRAGRVIGICCRSDILRMFLRTDEAIRKEIANGLLNELPLLGRGRIKVDVTEGVVHLRGDVETGPLTVLLLRLVAAVPGVVGVESHLQAPLVSAPRAASAEIPARA